MFHGTASLVVPGWYVEFQQALLRAAPRDITSDIALGWTNNGEGLVKVLRESLLPPEICNEQEVGVISKEKEWSIWKWIDIGLPNLCTADDFRSDFKANELRIGEHANSMMGHRDFIIAEKSLKLPLTKVTVAELGFFKGTPYNKICNRANNLGLDLCPAEVGPQLRRQYRDQPLGEWIVVAMKAILASDHILNVFGVGRQINVLWLRSFVGRPGYKFLPHAQLVFVPRKYQQKPLAA
jgi:hypothetical protein